MTFAKVICQSGNMKFFVEVLNIIMKILLSVGCWLLIILLRTYASMCVTVSLSAHLHFLSLTCYTGP